jgi:hypothetical protein
LYVQDAADVMIPCNSVILERFWDDRLAIFAEQFSSFDKAALILFFEYKSLDCFIRLLGLRDFSDCEGVNIALPLTTILVLEAITGSYAK